MKKTLILTITFFTTISILLGQTDKKTIIIKGRVYGQSKNENNFLPLATVYVKDTKTYCLTDTLGYYSLDISSLGDKGRKVVLVCRYIGYVIKEIPLGKIKNSISTDIILDAAPACNYPDVWSSIEIKSPDTAQYCKILKRGHDTLTFYRRHSNCDSVTFYKFQVFKQTQTYGIRTFLPVKYAQPKRCKDFFSADPRKLVFKQSQTCLHSPETINFMNGFEKAIRDLKRDTLNCSNKIQYSITIGNKYYKSKIKTCSQDIERLMNMYFGCAIEDTRQFQSGY